MGIGAIISCGVGGYEGGYDWEGCWGFRYIIVVKDVLRVWVQVFSGVVVGEMWGGLLVFLLMLFLWELQWVFVSP